jgi:hypothetical protein
MPYIKPEDRINKDGPISELAKVIKTPGDLNYVFSCLAAEYFLRNGGRYQQINDVEGVFAAASKEFYRRIAVPYENKKIQETGDLKQYDINYIKKYEIWIEGNLYHGCISRARYIGTSEGYSFEDACARFYVGNVNYHERTNEYIVEVGYETRNCKLFNNETDARKAYG